MCILYIKDVFLTPRLSYLIAKNMVMSISIIWISTDQVFRANITFASYELLTLKKSDQVVVNCHFLENIPEELYSFNTPELGLIAKRLLF